MTIKHRLNKLEKLSPESKTHQISQQDCFILNGDEDCTPETCRHGCWMTESEYKTYMNQNSDMISEWVQDENDTEQA